MNGRWKMNRIGFVNFWLYDEEDFWFEDGRLLLRGQNGSGKSITTQSFIPFILDGDRTPSRLDPFGSSDRRMEYYFLGEEGKDESTGYLFLELKREGAEEYRTVGIGQHAKRGKSMDFWGFVVLDNRRIGKDLWLYKESGSVKIPFDKREMRQELGEGNPFTDSPGEYKKLVNQHVFGFRKLEQYDQFIRLLVKVRAPKLSKELKPTKVYEILNDSLQTLTDEDLRPMVDAMEKMDEIQDSLETLKRAFDDVKIIRTEYIRYNQFMLARKGQLYLEKRRETEEKKKRLTALTRRKEELEAQQEEDRERLRREQERQGLIQAQRRSLLDADLEHMDERLRQAKEERERHLSLKREWSEKAEDFNGKVFAGERALTRLQDGLEQKREELRDRKAELEEYQETLRWDGHRDALAQLGEAALEGVFDAEAGLEEYGRKIEAGKKAIRAYEESQGRYDQEAQKLEDARRETMEKRAQQEQLAQRLEKEKNGWISALFAAEKGAEEWKPGREILLKAEELAARYETVLDGEGIRELLRADYEGQRMALLERRESAEKRKREQEDALKAAQEELSGVQKMRELKPQRAQLTEDSREALRRAGISAVPFYQTVEFAEGVSREAAARLEAQLQSMGLLDALVVAQKDRARIRKECPAFLDSVICVQETAKAHPGSGTAPFGLLTVNEEQEPGIRQETARILSCIRERISEGESGTGGLFIGADGSFCQGVLSGKADQEGEAAFVGQLARKRAKENRIRRLEEEIGRIRETIGELAREAETASARLAVLEGEYRALPGFSGLNEVLKNLESGEMELSILEKHLADQERNEREAGERKDRDYQSMLRLCRQLPYGRTEAEYGEALDCLNDYGRAWRSCRELKKEIGWAVENILQQKERIDQDSQSLDDALREKGRYGAMAEECAARIAQCEEYLNRPEIREKARRLGELGEELKALEKGLLEIRDSLTRADERLLAIEREEPEQKAALALAVGEEDCLRRYFEEELALKLVFDRESAPLEECAKKAAGQLRESDKNREPADMLQALYRVYQAHNGSLASYGTCLEDCFGADDGEASAEGAVRKRVRVVSVWNGKKVWLEEFYRILKGAIEETELLIRKKDRELFEDILSQTISRQLTDRIAESRKWVADMSKLMREMDTSMGMRFSLDWKPCSAQTQEELDVSALEQILLRDRALLTMEDIEKVASHFRSKIRTQKGLLEESGAVINYMELVREAMDYRRWFSFQMYYRRGEEQRKPLTNAAFNRFSGGEKAMAMYVPLFAAVNAQYQKAGAADHPRIIALDEAFAGVDDKNISSMFELVEKLDFDYIMNSQALWGCYGTVRGLRIAELLRPMNSQVVTVIRYTWNGRERILDEQ